jgi:hypothetical protein
VTPPLPVPAPGFAANPGAYPDMLPAGTKLVVQFANGRIDDKNTYEPCQLRWDLTGHPWDVGAVALASVPALMIEGRQSNGSYE